MLRSMTGYGRAKVSGASCEVTVEIRSVNHRYFDCSIRIPRIYVAMEEPIKSKVQSAVLRGKVDVFVTIEHTTDSNIDIQFNRGVAEAYVGALNSMKTLFTLKGEVELMQLARFPEVFTTAAKQPDEDDVLDAVLRATDIALEGHREMRIREGQNLEKDILEHALAIEELVNFVEGRSAKSIVEYRGKLTAKMNEILSDTNIDESRILTEAAIYSDRVSVDEEIVRLKSHIQQLRIMVGQGGAIGRKLDFLIQEFNRETNTIGSKAGDIEIGKAVVDMKSEVEKIREQVQNIE